MVELGRLDMDDIKFKNDIDMILRDFKGSDDQEWRMVAYKTYHPKRCIKYHFYKIPVPNSSQENYIICEGRLFNFTRSNINETEIDNEELRLKFINFINTIKE